MEKCGFWQQIHLKFEHLSLRYYCVLSALYHHYHQSDAFIITEKKQIVFLNRIYQACGACRTVDNLLRAHTQQHEFDDGKKEPFYWRD